MKLVHMCFNMLITSAGYVTAQCCFFFSVPRHILGRELQPSGPHLSAKTDSLFNKGFQHEDEPCCDGLGKFVYFILILHDDCDWTV